MTRVVHRVHAMGSELDISPFREASAFSAEVDRFVVIGIVAHKNGPHGENKLTAQLQILTNFRF